MNFFNTSDNVKTYYEIKGEGNPIIFIHGFTETHDSFRIQQRILSKKYKTITYDIRGHGLSSRVDYGLNMERLALDLKEFIDYLDLQDIVLVGWSMGTSIIFEYINIFGEYNLSKICIIDKGPKVLNDNNWNLGLYHGKYTMEDALKDLSLIKDNWMEFTERFIKSMAPYFNKKQFSISMDKMKNNSPNIMYSIWKSMIEKDYRKTLSKIHIPALIIFGGESTFYSIDTGRYLKENIINSELVIFQDCTHLLVLENPIRFNRVLEEFTSKY
ncbi:alpha/beta hydrolase [Tissierella pigra]|uniref:Alpha/beta hydrolase n=1 Tax=Tissierella pigra TaxID=2607614 RepID=A0A6N7XW60_9FIRM|nr:alpha/beta hydrolase [Tissierella pigra]MBU5428360.1 alpha/beta hydrolase [Tissierella pigra]MSU01683.1 alpha/beta hydrolase [Tissierella pigra]